MSMPGDDDLYLTGQVFVAGLLMLSAGAKALAPQDFRKVLTSWKSLPLQVVPTLVILVPCVELLLAIGVVVNPSSVGAPATAAFAVLLLGVTLFALARGERPECGCFGSLVRERLGVNTLLRQFVLLFTALLLLTSAPRLHPTIGILDAAAGVGLVLVLIEASAISQAVAALRTPTRRPMVDGGRVSLRDAPLDPALWPGPQVD